MVWEDTAGKDAGSTMVQNMVYGAFGRSKSKLSMYLFRLVVFL